ncbi:MerR family transcriptional regulator [Sphingomonas sp. RRHST34]|uniref:MerR family transcriptional regulator n=1 Tax=Sphingomonas citri TaxID=2862499 RepID=A0ABS7BNU8_9SPHN|nr:MerR family transcriptional regulator [Sphingomonas citri]MBW6531277.1 MerR family transcriptional regulator [Sphingomonas citri]
MVASDEKSAAAFRTIGEVAAATGVAPHVLRYWEERFPQLRPVTRAGNRRYYRPADIALIERIAALLGGEGYTIRGVQQLLARERSKSRGATPPVSPAPSAGDGPAPSETNQSQHELQGEAATLARVRVVRDWIAAALNDDRA